MLHSYVLVSHNVLPRNHIVSHLRACRYNLDSDLKAPEPLRNSASITAHPVGCQSAGAGPGRPVVDVPLNCGEMSMASNSAGASVGKSFSHEGLCGVGMEESPLEERGAVAFAENISLVAQCESTECLRTFLASEIASHDAHLFLVLQT